MSPALALLTRNFSSSTSYVCTRGLQYFFFHDVIDISSWRSCYSAKKKKASISRDFQTPFAKASRCKLCQSRPPGPWKNRSGLALTKPSCKIKAVFVPAFSIIENNFSTGRYRSALNEKALEVFPRC